VKSECGGGLLLLRHITPLTRRDVVYFYSGAHNLTGDYQWTGTRLAQGKFRSLRTSSHP
jgi:hypothetical protein